MDSVFGTDKISTMISSRNILLYTIIATRPPAGRDATVMKSLKLPLDQAHNCNFPKLHIHLDITKKNKPSKFDMEIFKNKTSGNHRDTVRKIRGVSGHTVTEELNLTAHQSRETK